VRRVRAKDDRRTVHVHLTEGGRKVVSEVTDRRRAEIETAELDRPQKLPSASSGENRKEDAGNQFTSVRYGERLAEIAVVRSIGSIGTIPGRFT